MSFKNESDTSSTTRREFLKHSSKATVGAALGSSFVSRAQEEGTRTVKIGLVGCGGRGTGAAANALQTNGPTQLWAMADVFPHRLEGSQKILDKKFGTEVAVPQERQFIGFNAFKKVIDSLGPGDLVILTTPPAFRPIHLEYAVEKGVNVFMEKSFAVDAPGIRRVISAGEAAKKKNLKIAGGLMSRHSISLEQAVKFIHDGGIGEVITAWAYRMHGPVGVKARQPDMTELAYQISNYSCFTWLNGSFIVDWLIHNIDVCCWVKNDWPVSVQGMGGRQVRQTADQLFDHYEAEYTFADGTRMLAQARHMNQCHNFFGDVIHGATGSAVLGEGITKPRIFKSHQQTAANQIWQYEGSPKDAYQEEHDRLFHAIRTDSPYNETERCAKSCMTAIMGRMACETGRRITWEEAIDSGHQLAPDLEHINSLNDPAPILPNPQGDYQIAMPGSTLATA
ncbi:MAG: Gfo/Idh/MocA family oxidoreductase [Verrucomicrobia bacterium]|jgi:myo-inositol 2-dehydrogenase / D-chiro-inositol 1-dehydrogenase|nr:Gfo/Idh/MocA family oxidoreductase [Verrucomicrobiota bacterium]